MAGAYGPSGEQGADMGSVSVSELTQGARVECSMGGLHGIHVGIQKDESCEGTGELTL